MSLQSNDVIVRIVWHQDQPDEFHVFFQDGRDDLVSGHRSKAEALAYDLGLILATDDLSSAEWIRQS